MDYRKEKNGDFVISAVTPEDQTFINAIIAAIEAYKATLVKESAAGDCGLNSAAGSVITVTMGETSPLEMMMAMLKSGNLKTVPDQGI